MILHFSPTGLTDGLPFMIPFGGLFRRLGSGRRDGCRYRVVEMPSRALTASRSSRTPDGSNFAQPASAAPCASGSATRASGARRHGVRIRVPAAVIATVNLKWAAGEESWE